VEGHTNLESTMPYLKPNRGKAVREKVNTRCLIKMRRVRDSLWRDRSCRVLDYANTVFAAIAETPQFATPKTVG